MRKQEVILTPLIGSDSISSATINSIQHQKKKIQKKRVNLQQLLLILN